MKGYLAINLIRKLTTYLFILGCFTAGAGEFTYTGKTPGPGLMPAQDTILSKKGIFIPDTILVSDTVQKFDTTHVLKSIHEADTIPVPRPVQQQDSLIQPADSSHIPGNVAANDSLQNDTTKKEPAPVL